VAKIPQSSVRFTLFPPLGVSSPLPGVRQTPHDKFSLSPGDSMASFVRAAKVSTTSSSSRTRRDSGESGNFFRRISLTQLAMQTCFHNKLRIGFLAVYIPISVSIGMLHIHDFWSGGSGFPVVQNHSAQGGARSPENGVCIACHFTAGHIVYHARFVPVLSPGRSVIIAPILNCTKSAPQPRSARAPPVLTLL